MAAADPLIRYKKLVVDIARRLRESDCAELVFMYGDKNNGETALRVLEGFIERGIVTLTQPETLKKVVKSVNRDDLSKEIDKHVKDWAKQDKKIQPSIKSGATCNAKQFSLKETNFKAGFDQVISQAELLVKHIEDLREKLSADDDEVYRSAARILGEIQVKTDEVKSKLRKARSEAKLGDTAFSDLKIACEGLTQELLKTVCHSDPIPRKTYGKPHLIDAAQNKLQSRSPGSSSGKRPILPPHLRKPSLDNRCGTNKVPLRKDSAQQALHVNAAPEQRLSATSDYSTGSGSFGDVNSFRKSPPPNTDDVGKDASYYEPLDTNAITETSDVYSTPTSRSSHPEGSKESISSEGKTISNAEEVYEPVECCMPLQQIRSTY